MACRGLNETIRLGSIHVAQFSHRRYHAAVGVIAVALITAANDVTVADDHVAAAALDGLGEGAAPANWSALQPSSLVIRLITHIPLLRESRIQQALLRETLL